MEVVEEQEEPLVYTKEVCTRVLGSTERETHVKTPSFLGGFSTFDHFFCLKIESFRTSQI